MMELSFYAQLIAKEQNIAYPYVNNTLTLLSEGATIPFVARYRKELTGSMNEEMIETVQKRWQQLEALDKRREAIRSSLLEQDKLTDSLLAQINQAETLQALEDL
ncbi:MAG: RNA-binding transcriptional accessory protein, partial [Bacteroidales bacterium]|nr:RNA-binding transcriptional accessory protein [Bacteroidales bacterium]